MSFRLGFQVLAVLQLHGQSDLLWDNYLLAIIWRYFPSVKEDAAYADWEDGPEHVCGRGMCASNLSLVWKPERQQAYVGQLEKNEEMQVQFEDAVDAGNVDTAAFCLRS